MHPPPSRVDECDPPFPLHPSPYSQGRLLPATRPRPQVGSVSASCRLPLGLLQVCWGPQHNGPGCWGPVQPPRLSQPHVLTPCSSLHARRLRAAATRRAAGVPPAAVRRAPPTRAPPEVRGARAHGRAAAPHPRPAACRQHARVQGAGGDGRLALPLRTSTLPPQSSSEGPDWPAQQACQQAQGHGVSVPGQAWAWTREEAEGVRRPPRLPQEGGLALPRPVSADNGEGRRQQGED